MERLPAVFPLRRAGEIKGSTAWMKFLVDGLEAFPIHVGIALGGRDIDMSEHFLHGAQVGAAFEEMGGEGVAQGMGRDL